MLKDSGSQSVEALVKRHVSNAAVVGNIGSDLVFCLPHLDNEGNHQRSKFALLFDELDTIIERLGFSSYGISDTTLEEVSRFSALYFSTTYVFFIRRFAGLS